MNSLTDIIFFILYISALLYIGRKAKKKDPTREEYLLNNRSLTLPAFVATLVTTWYGGILGIGEFIYLYGLSAWFVFGVPYYFFAAIFAVYFAPKIRSQNYISIPDLLYQNYGKTAGLTGSLFVILITNPAPYILITAILIGYIFDLSISVAVIIALVFSIGYVFKGGFRSVTQTDKLQFILMFIGFSLLIVFLIVNYGSPLSAFLKLPVQHQKASGGLPLQSLIVWFLIASWTFIDPGFHQRSAAAQSPEIARKGVLVSIVFWFIFDMLTLWSGIYAVSIIQTSDPLLIYPLLAEQVLPGFIKSIFIIGLLAAAMSTTDSFTFICGQTFGRDIIATWNNKNSDAEITHYTQIGLFITALISLLLIWWVPSVVKMWYTLGSLFIPPLLLPVLLALLKYKKRGRINILLVMAGSFFITTSWLIYGLLNNHIYPWGLEPFIPGLIFSFIATFLIKKRTGNKSGFPEY
jgi:SSS family solute:Na+ symporter